MFPTHFLDKSAESCAIFLPKSRASSKTKSRRLYSAFVMETLPEFLHSPYWMMFQLFRRIQCHHTTDPFRGAWKAVVRSTLSVPQALGIPMPLTRGMYAIVLLSGLTSRATTEKPRMCGTRCASIPTLQCFNAHGLGLSYEPIRTTTRQGHSAFSPLMDCACCRSRLVLTPTSSPHIRSRTDKRANEGATRRYAPCFLFAGARRRFQCGLPSGYRSRLRYDAEFQSGIQPSQWIDLPKSHTLR